MVECPNECVESSAYEERSNFACVVHEFDYEKIAISKYAKEA